MSNQKTEKKFIEHEIESLSNMLACALVLIEDSEIIEDKELLNYKTFLSSIEEKIVKFNQIKDPNISDTILEIESLKKDISEFQVKLSYIQTFHEVEENLLAIRHLYNDSILLKIPENLRGKDFYQRKNEIKEKILTFKKEIKNLENKSETICLENFKSLSDLKNNIALEQKKLSTLIHELDIENQKNVSTPENISEFFSEFSKEIKNTVFSDSSFESITKDFEELKQKYQILLRKIENMQNFSSEFKNEEFEGYEEIEALKSSIGSLQEKFNQLKKSTVSNSDIESFENLIKYQNLKIEKSQDKVEDYHKGLLIQEIDDIISNFSGPLEKLKKILSEIQENFSKIQALNYSSDDEIKDLKEIFEKYKSYHQKMLKEFKGRKILPVNTIETIEFIKIDLESLTQKNSEVELELLEFSSLLIEKLSAFKDSNQNLKEESLEANKNKKSIEIKTQNAEFHPYSEVKKTKDTVSVVHKEVENKNSSDSDDGFVSFPGFFSTKMKEFKNFVSEVDENSRVFLNNIVDNVEGLINSGSAVNKKDLESDKKCYEESIEKLKKNINKFSNEISSKNRLVSKLKSKLDNIPSSKVKKDIHELKLELENINSTIKKSSSFLENWFNIILKLVFSGLLIESAAFTDFKTLFSTLYTNLEKNNVENFDEDLMRLEKLLDEIPTGKISEKLLAKNAYLEIKICVLNKQVKVFQDKKESFEDELTNYEFLLSCTDEKLKKFATEAAQTADSVTASAVVSESPKFFTHRFDFFTSNTSSSFDLNSKNLDNSNDSNNSSGDESDKVYKN